MSEVRHFSLINSIGSVCDITTQERFYGEFDGLGYSRSITYRQVGTRFVKVSDDYEQAATKGTMYFQTLEYAVPAVASDEQFEGDEVYKRYFDFMQFCKLEPLRMVYTREGSTFYRDCLVTVSEKSEIDKDTRALKADITFTFTDPWYKIVNVATPVVKQTAFSWTWGVTWPSDGSGVMWGSTSDGMILVINSDSYEDSPCKLTIYGPITNPTWTHYVNGVEYERGAFSATTTVTNGNFLVVDNTTDPFSMEIYEGSTKNPVKDVYQNRDFSTAGFITLKHGENVISVKSAADASVRVNIKAEGRLYYATV